LEREYPDAAASLREGLEELFTINRLGLSPALCRALGSTKIIDNLNSAARRRTGRAARWRDGEMVKRWVAAAFLDADKNFRRVLGYCDLWMLKAVLTGIVRLAFRKKIYASSGPFDHAHFSERLYPTAPA
jgi:putative transposase